MTGAQTGQVRKDGGEALGVDPDGFEAVTQVSLELTTLMLVPSL